MIAHDLSKAVHAGIIEYVVEVANRILNWDDFREYQSVNDGLIIAFGGERRLLGTLRC